MNKTKFIGLIIGIIFLIATCLLPSPESLNNKAWLTLGVAILMATWWLTEAIPLPATGLVAYSTFSSIRYKSL